MGHAFQHNPSSGPPGSEPLPKLTGLGQSSGRLDELSTLSEEERNRFRVNLERLQSLIETFCEKMHHLVVTPLAELASKSEISYKEMTDCWLNSWSVHRDLLADFQDGMRFFRELDPGHVGVYYADLTKETRDCISDLSDVVSLDRSEWASRIQEITSRFRAALSQDANCITGVIREDLVILKLLTVNSPEEP